MENKCNKTPNNSSKYLDHVYCHSSESKNYIRASHNNNNSNHNSNASGGGGAAGGSSIGGDILALLKENKQLKTMLILHLDLIQEQNDQLLAKDKQLAAQHETQETLRTRAAQLEAQVAELQKQLQRQIKRAAAASAVGGGERSSLPPPPLAKIQCKSTATASAASGAAAGESKRTSVIGECNGKLISKIILHRVTLPGREGGTCSPISTSASETASDAGYKKHEEEDEEEDEEDDDDAEETHEEEDDDEVEEEEDDDDDEEEEDEDEENDDDDDVGSGSGSASGDHSTEDSNDVLVPRPKRLRLRQPAVTTPTAPVSRGAKPRRPLAVVTETTPPPTPTHNLSTVASVGAASTSFLPTTSSTLQVCVTPPTPSRGKQMPLMLWHAPDLHESDESASCDSIAEVEQRSTSVITPPATSVKTTASAAKKSKNSTHLAAPSSTQSHQNQQNAGSKPRRRRRRCPHISTSQMYCTREWEWQDDNDDDELHGDYEYAKTQQQHQAADEESNAQLHVDAPMLEIPKWIEHPELTPSYCIEGTEDLGDETFHKRHAKLEVDEKRRKKWDVQQIREQRRIEKLKRRHCKDELQAATPEQQTLLSFYPLPESVQTICFVHDLPVQAFGEMIPKLNSHATDFALPWLETSAGGGGGGASTPSSFVATLASGNVNPNSAQAQHQMLNSSFVMLKKRKRQQSASAATPSARQRNATTKNSAAATTTTTTAVTAATATLTTTLTTTQTHAAPAVPPTAATSTI